jgi:hypothetical protein
MYGDGRERDQAACMMPRAIRAALVAGHCGNRLVATAVATKQITEFAVLTAEESAGRTDRT